MSTDPFPAPSRYRVRGTFPVHAVHVPFPARLSAWQAARVARRRLEQWRRANGG